MKKIELQELKKLFEKHHPEEVKKLQTGSERDKRFAGLVWHGFKSAFNIVEKSLTELETLGFDGDDTDTTRENKSSNNHHFINVFKKKLQKVTSQ